MPIDAYFIKGLCKELDSNLKGAKIEKIYMPKKDRVLFHLRSGSESIRLMISVGTYPAVWETREKYDNPESPSSFCMLLRKHFASGRIVSVSQPDNERIIEITLKAADEMGDISEKKIICEYIGRQKNLILVNEKGIIFACLKSVQPETDRRGILPGLSYRLPSSSSKPCLFNMTKKQIASICGKAPEFEAEKYFCDEIGGITLSAARYAVSSGDPLDFFVSMIENEPEPYILYKENEICDLSAVKPKDIKSVKAESFSHALDLFYGKKSREDIQKEQKSNLYKTLINAEKRLEKKTAEQKIELCAAVDRNKIKEKADLIKSNISFIKPGQKTVSVIDYYDPSLAKKTIEIDPLLSPQQNAQKLYKKYERLKNAEKHLKEQIEKGERELSYIKSLIYELSLSDGAEEINAVKKEASENGFLKKDGKKSKPLKAYPKRFKTSSGIEVLCGRNNNENDELTFKIAAKKDLWFHARGVPGSHVVLICRDLETVSTEDIEDAAGLAAYYCADKGDKTAVDYTFVKNVKKPAGSRPGAVNYFEYKSVFISPKLLCEVKD